MLTIIEETAELFLACVESENYNTDIWRLS